MRAVRWLVVVLLVACGHRHVAGLADAVVAGDSQGAGDSASDSGGGTDGAGPMDASGSGNGSGGGNGSGNGNGSGSGNGNGSGSGNGNGSGSGSGSGGGGPCTNVAVCSGMFSTANGAALAVAVDSARNVYVAGEVTGDLVIGNQTVYAIGNRDSFVASFTESGTLRWVKRLGGAGAYSDAYGIAVDANANVYVVGGGGSIDLGGGVTSGVGMFIVSYTSDGTWRWARGDGGEGLLGVATAGSRVFAIGRFQNSLTIAPLPALQSAGAEDVVIASFDSATGSAQWDRSIGTAATDDEGGITAHDSWLAFSVSTGSGNRLVSYTAAGANRYDIALDAALDIRGLTSDAAGNLYLAGLHTGGTDTIDGAPYEDGDNPFVHGFDATLASRWSHTLSIAPARHVSAIPLTSPSIDPRGALVLAGTYDGTLYAGGTPLTLGQEHIFIAHYGADGIPAGARKLDDGTSTAYEWVHASAIDSAGAIYVAGQYFGTPNFGSGAMTYAPQGGPLLLKLAP